MMRPAHARDLRKGRWSEAGRIYLVTAVTRDRRPVFYGLHPARVLIQTLRSEETQGRAKTLAFVVMPDHLHWLLQLGAGSDLSEVVRAVKAVSAKRLGRPLWQRGFHDHALRQDEDLVAAARYVIANPLRRVLVNRVADYPHWDAVWV